MGLLLLELDELPTRICVRSTTTGDKYRNTDVDPICTNDHVRSYRSPIDECYRGGFRVHSDNP